MTFTRRLQQVWDLTEPSEKRPQGTASNKALLVAELALGLGSLYFAMVAQDPALRVVGWLGGATLSYETFTRGRRIEDGVEAELEGFMTAQDKRLFGPSAKPVETVSMDGARRSGMDVLDDVIRKRDQYPFVFVLAPQGCGKTALGHSLVAQSRLAGNRTLVCTHNYEPGDWAAADKFIFPENIDRPWFDFSENPNVRLEDLPTGATYLQTIMAIGAEYRYRRKHGLTYKDTPDLTRWDIVIDEAPGVYGALSDKTQVRDYLTYTGLIDLFRFDLDHKRAGEINTAKLNDEIQQLGSQWRNWVVHKGLKELRKYGLRIFLLGQTSTVSELGMQGMGKLRDASATIHLGSYCNEHLTEGQKAKQEKNQHTFMTLNGVVYEKPGSDDLEYPIYQVLKKHGTGAQPSTSTPQQRPSADPVRQAVDCAQQRGLSLSKLLDDSEVKEAVKNAGGPLKSNKYRKDRQQWLTENGYLD